MSLSSFTRAQKGNLGIELGPNVSNFVYTSQVYFKNTKFGFLFNLYYQQPIDNSIFLKYGLALENSGYFYKARFIRDDYKLNFWHLRLPLELKYELHRFSVSAGIQLGILIMGRGIFYSYEDDVRKEYSQASMGLGFGINYSVLRTRKYVFGIGVRDNINWVGIGKNREKINSTSILFFVKKMK